MLDYDIASYQRSVIKESVKLLRRAGVSNLPLLPKCKGGNPCGDGRCPKCGVDLQGLLLDFDHSPSARSQQWQRTALAYEFKHGTSAEEPSYILDKMKGAAIDIIDQLLKRGRSESDERFAFIGTTGIRYTERSRLSHTKLAIFECTITGTDEAVSVVHEGFRNLFQDRVSYLPPLSEPSLGAFKTLQLMENLLLPYDEYRCHGLEIDDQLGESLLIEMANNYGPHRIETRLVTYGLDYNKGEISFAQRPWLPAQFEVPVMMA